MNTNKWILVAVAAVIVVAGVVVFTRPQKQAPTPASTTEQKSSFDPKNPGFTVGTVTKVQSDQIEFKIGPTTATAKIGSDTKLAKQVRDKTTKLITVVDATVADFKPGQDIVVSFSVPPKDGVYQADKIQIIAQ